MLSLGRASFASEFAGCARPAPIQVSGVQSRDAQSDSSSKKRCGENPAHRRGGSTRRGKRNAMDLMNMLIVIVGLGTAAFIAIVLVGAAGACLHGAWSRLAHRNSLH